jgi:Putative  PD-(D/E)XK family member, (DUF4420)
MTLIEALWQSLVAKGELGGARRIDATHPCDIYATLADDGRPGLMLVTDVPLPVAPRLSAVEATTARRQDGRWCLGIWLGVESLRSPFAQLCQDLVDATRGVSPETAGGFMLARLARWRQLLEGSHAISLVELRGLVGELLVLKRCAEVWAPTDVVDAWVGPLGAPQDFTLPALLLEVKTTRPGSPTVQISSLNQLDGPGKLLLAVVALAEVSPEGQGFQVASLVAEIRESLSPESPTARLEFDARLSAAGYRDDDQITQTLFRCDDVRYFEVRAGFPAIRQGDVVAGVVAASYEISLAACHPFESQLGAPNGAG